MKAYFDGPTPNLAQCNNENNVDVYNVEEVSERYKDTMNDAQNVNASMIMMSIGDSMTYIG